MLETGKIVIIWYFHVKKKLTGQFNIRFASLFADSAIVYFR